MPDHHTHDAMHDEKIARPSYTYAMHDEKIARPSHTYAMHDEKIARPSHTHAVHDEKIARPSHTCHGAMHLLIIRHDEDSQTITHIRHA